MNLATYTKSPAERKRYAIDYLEWLDTGETVSSVVFGVTQCGTDTPVQPLVIDAFMIDPTGSSVVFYAAMGDADEHYIVDVQMTTDGGQVKEDTIKFNVQDEATC